MAICLDGDTDQRSRAQVATFTAEYNDASEKLEAVLSKLDRVSKEKKEHVSAIEAAKGLCDQYTRSDVLKLKGKLRSHRECGRGGNS